MFFNRFKQYEEMSYEKVSSDLENSFNMVMPWTIYAEMNEVDLKAIYAYLKTAEPVKQRVVRFTPQSVISVLK